MNVFVSNTCSICLNSIYVLKRNKYRLWCGHLYHKKCILEFFFADAKQRKTCPFCCQELPNKEESKLFSMKSKNGISRILFKYIYFIDLEWCLKTSYHCNKKLYNNLTPFVSKRELVSFLICKKDKTFENWKYGVDPFELKNNKNIYEEALDTNDRETIIWVNRTWPKKNKSIYQKIPSAPYLV